eukprot:CAMPEP_0194290532 /NCGR_PEP_ID=MMETSP0169-20130528/41412_1 /TAXON_ID=218684 /ORGANISM="Corethron pennatum, Strain L29A3" /LENGTH=402 /DNA_ID=CAMNT_0039038131 /DNA_START=51 /DNA_END=1259 /DNA_ORIENTATION=+
MADDSKNEESSLLTVDTVSTWLASQASIISVLPDDVDASSLSASAIIGGNMNYAFRVTAPPPIPSIFVKQAPEFVAIFGPGGYDITSERMQKEMDVYDEFRSILGPETNYLPTIYAFDKEKMITVMEFFEGHQLLDVEMVENGLIDPVIASGLGEFMGKIHASTHSSIVPVARMKYLTEYYENQPMRDIQLEFVFTKCYVEATDDERAGLVLDEAFMAEVEALKAAYNGKIENACGYVLSHGDLHPGSVMVDSEKKSVKVIDPEFCVYGPPGLDLGSLLSGYVLAAVHHSHSGQSGATEAVTSIRDGAHKIWKEYTQIMEIEGKFDATFIKKIGAEAVGFAVAETCRTALGKAGGRLWLQFEDKEVKAAAIKTCMGIVQRCMVERHAGGMDLLLAELDGLKV